jgi:DNA-binding PadR family transcriptional regulator
VYKLHGLLETVVNGFPKRRYIKLTEKGKRVVEKLKELYSLIEDSS